MKIKDNELIEYNVQLKHESYCNDCYSRLDWEVHDPGNLQGEKWVSYCECNNHQRMWILRAETYRTESING